MEEMNAKALEYAGGDRYLLSVATGKRVEELFKGAKPLIDVDVKKQKKMRLIENEEQLLRNIETLESYLTEGNDYESKEATLLVKRGTCFVAYKIDKEIRFAPSRFIGYFDNKLDRHSVALDKDGRETNKAINQIHIVTGKQIGRAHV